MSFPKETIGVGGLRIGPREREYVLRALDSHRLSYGPFTRRFENLFAKLHDSRFAVFCNSGTSALHIALQALKEKHRWKDGDEVLVPAVTFVATSNIVLHNRMTPVFVDVRPDTYNIDPALIEKKITRKTRAIIPVHLLGLPADMGAISKIARRRGLKVIEDSCETMFARCAGRKVGSLGDIGCFSTYIAHYIVAGIGGLATTSDPDLAVRLRSLMNHGRDSIYISIDDDNNARGAKFEEIVARRFKFQHVGHSFRATELEAALGLAQLENWKNTLKTRQAIARKYIAGLSDLQDELQLPVVPPGQEHVFMLFPLVTRQKSKKDLVHFLERRGVETRDLLPLINQPIYRKMFGNLDKEYPVARRLNSHGFYIGCHQYISRREQEHVIKTIRRFFKK
ncbi:MAG TPA: DegT/DnrJ/EryC1/StrS family aminotransferase [Elusimicrobiota bacterium]|nr:DegT/DnrJ/EryC1/StrS family aminotransferase [Elusimicrobiota bacterium]